MQLDTLDCQILLTLQREARIKNKDIAARIGLSASACLERIRRLERSGVIVGYRAILDHSAMGWPLEVWGEITLVDQSPKNLTAFSDLLQRTQSILAAYRLAGRHDYLLHSVAPSMNAWDAFLQRVNDDGIAIAAAKTSVVVERAKHNAPLAIGGVAPRSGNSSV